MKRIVVVAAAVIAFLGVLSPPVSAQTTAPTPAAPAPKVTITGLIDTITTAAKNFDGNFASNQEGGWWVRNRGVFYITGELGKAKGVLALEIDLGWGQVSNNESVVSNSGQTLSSSGGQLGSAQGAFQQGAWDSGNDVGGVIEVKNLYVEFPLPIPIPTVVRLGGQPYQVTLKPFMLATTDYGGVWMQTTLAPWAKLNFTYAALEEAQTGFFNTAGNLYWRGDDFFIVGSLDLEPVKGITLRPFYGFFRAEGNTHNQARCRVQCAGLPTQGTGTGVNNITGLVTSPAMGNYALGDEESRHYFGIDAQMNFGPFFVDPTFIYQYGRADVHRQTSAGVAGIGILPGVACAAGTATPLAGLCQGGGPAIRQKTSAWLADLRAGWRAGPLLVEGMVMYTPGDADNRDSFTSTRNYHPMNVDIAYAAGWSEILSLGSVDYFTATGHGMGENIGLGRYGRRQIGARVSYAITPAFTVSVKGAAAQTDKKVDTDSIAAAAAAAPGAAVTAASYGAVPCALRGVALPNPNGTFTTTFPLAANPACTVNNGGDSRNIGVELSLGATYRFAPGLTFDIVGAYLISGHALDTTYIPTGGVAGNPIKDPAKDAKLLSARVRYQF